MYQPECAHNKIFYVEVSCFVDIKDNGYVMNLFEGFLNTCAQTYRPFLAKYTYKYIKLCIYDHKMYNNKRLVFRVKFGVLTWLMPQFI